MPPIWQTARYVLPMSAPPDVFVAPEPPSQRGVVVFTLPQVNVATLLGSPLAGGALLAFNARRLGLPLGRAIGGTALVTAILVVAAVLLPDEIPVLVFNVAGYFATRAYAESEQGEALQRHRAAGGVAAPWLTAFAAGLAFPAVIAAVALALVLQGSLTL